MPMIRKNDIVGVIAGKDKGKKGKVLTVFPKAGKAVVESLNIVKKARRKSRQDQQGGLVSIEAPIHLSNLMLFCKRCDKPSKFKMAILKDKTKIRECKKCGATL